jgi:hypothetical protein
MRSQNRHRSLSPPCYSPKKPQIHNLQCDGLLDDLHSVFYFLGDISMPASVTFLGRGPAWSLHYSNGHIRLHICPFCHSCYNGLDFGYFTHLYCSQPAYALACESFDCSAALLRECVSPQLPQTRHLFTSPSGSIATLLRIRYIQQLDATSDFLCTSASHQLPSFLTKPVEIANLAIWSTVELGIGIIAGSLATYRPLFRFLYSETASFRSRTRRTTPTISSGHVGYERTSSAPSKTISKSNHSSSILTTNEAPLSQKARRWYGQNQEYEMDENMTGVTSSETPGV